MLTAHKSVLGYSLRIVIYGPEYILTKQDPGHGSHEAKNAEEFFTCFDWDE